jgi:uncharacterized protein (DUF1015 family)
MLYSDPALTVDRTLFRPGFRAEIEFTDEFGVEHRLTRVTEPNTINILAGAMADKKLIIADGHHRYETALAYARQHAPASLPHQERNLSNSVPTPPYPAGAAMMHFVNMDGDGLTILPTHRVLFDLAGFDTTAFLAKAEACFSIERLGANDLSTQLRKLAEANRPAFLFVADHGRFLLTGKPDAVADALAHLSERQRRLDVVVLHALVLEKLLGIKPEAIREQTHLRYVREAHEALEQVTEGLANAAFLMNACTLDQLREIAFAGDVMPQKSTDFYPKLLDGLAIYALD